MKPFVLLALLSASAIPLAAQTDPPAANANRSINPERARRVMAPPEANRSPSKARPSTAEAGAVREAKAPLKTLPALAVTGSDKHPHELLPAEHSGHWLLLYRTEHCVACDRLMNVLAASQSADLRKGIPYTVIVAGGKSSDSIDKVRSNFAQLEQANWVEDRENHFLKSLELHGAPVLLAMDGKRVAWRVAGNLGDPALVLRMADGWIAGTAAAAQAQAQKSAKISPATP